MIVLNFKIQRRCVYIVSGKDVGCSPRSCGFWR